MYNIVIVSNYIVLWMSGVVLSCLCAVLSKEQGITVVGVCLIYEFFLLHKVGHLHVLM